MKIVWPDGMVEEFPDVTPEKAKSLLGYAVWFCELTKAEQKAIVAALEAHIRKSESEMVQLTE